MRIAIRTTTIAFAAAATLALTACSADTTAEEGEEAVTTPPATDTATETPVAEETTEEAAEEATEEAEEPAEEPAGEAAGLDATAEELDAFNQTLGFFDLTTFDEQQSLEIAAYTCSSADSGNYTGGAMEGGADLTLDAAAEFGIDTTTQFAEYMELSMIMGASIGVFCPEHEALFAS